MSPGVEDLSNASPEQTPKGKEFKLGLSDYSTGRCGKIVSMCNAKKGN